MNKKKTAAAKWLVTVFALFLIALNFAVVSEQIPVELFTGELPISEFISSFGNTPAAPTVSPSDTVTPSDVVVDVPYSPEQDFSDAPISETTGLWLVSTGGEYSEDQLEYITEFYSDCVFVGDSVTVQFQKYVDKVSDPVFSKSKFLCNTSFSAYNSLWDLDNPQAVHPMFRGEMRYVWDSVSMMDVEKVFVAFWANEFSVYDRTTIPGHFAQLIANIREKSPDVEVYLISPCFIHYSYQSKKLNNKNIKTLQDQLKEYCAENDVHYVELAQYLGSLERGHYPPYSSDRKVHMSARGLDVWLRVLKDYALGVETPLEDLPVPES